MVAHIKANLETTREEVERYSKWAVQQLYQVALARKTKLEDDAKTASGFSFKVT
jgi:hypothetical protein